jgi:hypothetical protein
VAINHLLFQFCGFNINACPLVDPEEFFKQSFGGDRFVDIIGEISIGRDMRDAIETAENDGEGNEADLSPEEKAERAAQKEKAEKERAEIREARIQAIIIYRVTGYISHFRCCFH